MQLIKEILETIDSDQPVVEAVVGTFITMIRSEKQAGLSSTFRQPCPDATHAGIESAGKLTTFSLKELALWALSENLIEASVGMAALNALVPVPEKFDIDRKAQELILEKAAGKNLAIVGNFPFIKKIRSRMNRFELINELPHLGKRGVAHAETVFPEMDVIAITGSAFINHTIYDLLELAAHAYVIVLGATTPFSTVLFDHGVDAICGTIVAEPEKIAPYVTQGVTFRKLPCIRRVTWCKSETT